MGKEIEHEDTNDITCPHCGYEVGYSLDLNDDEGEIDCDGCGKPYEFERTIIVTYSTKKVACKTKPNSSSVPSEADSTHWANR